MNNEKFLESYSGQSTDELIALEVDCRIDSIVLAFEQAIGQKAVRQPISTEESYVLAVEELEREVNNGGYKLFFDNKRTEFTSFSVDALQAIGCPKTAEITEDAISALRINGDLLDEKMKAALFSDDASIDDKLAACDDRYFANDEPIADRLFEWIKQNRANIRIGNA